jgi:adenylate cyclase
MNTSRPLAHSQSLLTRQCWMCGTPLSGFLGYFTRIGGVTRSERNPNICNRCNSHVREGQMVELSVLFADLSKFTELTHNIGSEQTSAVVSAFLDMATTTMLRYGAFIDRYMGDAVMAFFNMPMRQDDHVAKAVAAGVEIQAGIDSLRKRFNLELNSSIGIATGLVWVGSLGSAVCKDYSAIGEVVNLAARLEEKALPGEILVQTEVYDKVAADFPEASNKTFELKGFQDPVVAYSLGRYAAHSEKAPVGKYFNPSANLSVGAVIFSFLGAPCAVGTLIGPVAVALGIGSLFGTTMAAWSFLDKPWFQYPVFVLAFLASIANLYTVWRARQLRKQSQQTTTVIMRNSYRPALLVGLSIANLLIIALELNFHPMMK